MVLNNNITIASANVNSILPKFPEVKARMFLNKYDVFCVQESKLSKSTPDSVLTIPGYNLFRNLTLYSFSNSSITAIIWRRPSVVGDNNVRLSAYASVP